MPDGQYLGIRIQLGRTQFQGDAIMECLEAEGATLNPEKCGFGKTSVWFLRHIVDQVGI